MQCYLSSGRRKILRSSHFCLCDNATACEDFQSSWSKIIQFILNETATRCVSPLQAIDIHCLQLVLSCCIFLSSLSVHCHEKERIRYKGELLPRSWRKKKKNNMEKKVGAELENGTICLHLSHNYWDCSNFRDAKIPLKANKSSLKSELIFPRGLHASPWKTLRDAHLKVREGDALNIQFPNISSSCLDNYVGLLAQVFVLGILNAGWHLLWTVMLLEIFDLPVCGGSVCSLQCNSTLSW